MAQNTSTSTTKKGTPPQPKRRSTKAKQPAAFVPSKKARVRAAAAAAGKDAP